MPRFSNLTLREDRLNDEKSRFYVGHGHFEASQCPRVVGSAQDGERAPGAKAKCGRDPGNRPMRRRVLNALKSETRQNPLKRGLILIRFLDDNWNPKLCLLTPSCTGSATVSVLNLDILFSVNWKNRNVNFPMAPITFRGTRLAGSYDLRRKVGGQRRPKDPRQQRHNLRAMRRL